MLSIVTKKFKVSSYERISKYKLIFMKGHTPNWSEQVHKIKKVKTMYRRHASKVVSMVKKFLEHL